tara:strand:+ start:41 stop:418 length:378 start_codon:yes stop_codon:yes gene_type:complete
VVDTVFPVLAKIAFEAGEIVNISFPLGVPVKEIPRPIVVPLIVILEGVEEDKLATPPDIANEKSETAKVDVELDVPPYTRDVNVTETVELFKAIWALFISGTLVTLTVKALAKFDVPSLTFTYIL